MLDVATQLFTQLRKRGVSLLLQWVENADREDLHLDFKRKSSDEEQRSHPDDLRNFSKALSGFANSDGGLLVWGVDAPSTGQGRRVAMPIKDPQLFAEMLDSMTSRLVAPAVEGVQNEVFYIDHDTPEKLGFVVTLIPRSSAAPHRAEAHSLKRYYQRSGDSFVQLEHFQLEYMFGRRLVPDLKITWRLSQEWRPSKKEDGQKHFCRLQIGIKNRGRAIARYTCLRIRYRLKKDRYKFEEHRKEPLITYSNPHLSSLKDHMEVVARADPGLVIYPQDKTMFVSFQFSVSHEELLQEALPPLVLYYDLFGDGVKSRFSEKLIIDGALLCRIIRKE